MPKTPRIHYEGAVYHVVARGVRQTPLFLDDQDRLFFLDRLDAAKVRVCAALLLYCLMTNHFHLAIQVGQVALDRLMQTLNLAYARYFNRKYGFAGHVFEKRYWPKLCRTDVYFATLARYIHDNPVGVMVGHPGEYEWSSYRGIRDRNSRLIDFAALDAIAPMADLTAEGPFITSVPPECYIDTGIAFDEERKIPDLAAVAARVAPGREGLLSGPSRIRQLSALRKEFCRKAAAEGARDIDIARFLNRSATYVAKARTS